MKILSFNYAVFALIVGALTATPAFAQCPEGKIEILMTTPSGNTKIRCVSESAATGIENAADHAVVEISTSCPCWTQEELEGYDSKVEGLVCDEKTDGSGMECHTATSKDPLIETASGDTYNVCIDTFDSEKLQISGLEYEACDRSMINLDPYNLCPCWSEKDLAWVSDNYPFECSDNSTGDSVDCYITNTSKLIISVLSTTGGNACLIQGVLSEDIKLETTDREHLGCISSLDSYRIP